MPGSNNVLKLLADGSWLVEFSFKYKVKCSHFVSSIFFSFFFFLINTDIPGIQHSQKGAGTLLFPQISLSPPTTNSFTPDNGSVCSRDSCGSILLLLSMRGRCTRDAVFVSSSLVCGRFVLLFYCQVVFHCATVPQSIHSLTDETRVIPSLRLWWMKLLLIFT